MNHHKDTKKLIEAFTDFARAQNIDRATVTKVLEDTFKAVLKQRFGNDVTFDVILNLDQGDLQIWRYRDIVDDSAAEANESGFISLSEAKKIESDFEIGEQVADEIDLGGFGRRAVYVAKQSLVNTMHDIKMGAVLNKYGNRIGELVTAEVDFAYSKEAILVDDEGFELVLPRHQQIRKDRLRKGDYVKAVICDIQNVRNKNRVLLSRTSPKFLQALLEAEIPELREGIIEIKDIVREPGERAKVAVKTYSENVDPIGACVGVRGSRIHGIVKELHNESIDIVSYTDSMDLYITRALSPAKVSSIKYLSNDKVAVYLRPDQVSKAIGIGGYNIKLASRLVGLEIDVYREMTGSDDSLLDEFADRIDEETIEELKTLGFSTVKQVLALSQDELKSKLQVDTSKLSAIYRILTESFIG